MFKYNEEMRKAIKEELLKIVKFKVFTPNKKGNPVVFSQKELDKMRFDYKPVREMVAWYFERGLYEDILNDYHTIYEPFPVEIETNDTSKAKDVAKAVYDSFLNDSLKRHLGGNEEDYEWYLSLPTKQFYK